MFHGFFCFFRDEKATLKMKKTDFQDEKVTVLLRKRGINENFEKTSGKYFQNYAVTMKSSMKGNLKKGEKMVGVLIATHGGFAEGILNAVELIAGKQEGVKTIGLFHGDGIDEFSDKVQTAYEELDDGDGVLVFVDIFGGSPSNAVMKLISQKPEVKAIAGLNMPMLVEAFLTREGSTVEELCDRCKQAGVQNQVLVHEKYQELTQSMTQDDDDDF